MVLFLGEDVVMEDERWLGGAWGVAGTQGLCEEEGMHPADL